MYIYIFIYHKRCLYFVATTQYTNNYVMITCIFWAFLSKYEKNKTYFLKGRLFSELCCRIPWNWKYIYLFLIGNCTTTSWRTYHQAFSVRILSWKGCKFGVSLNIGVRGTRENQSSKQIFECVGAITYYGSYPNRTALTLGLGKVSSLLIIHLCTEGWQKKFKKSA